MSDNVIEMNPVRPQSGSFSVDVSRGSVSGAVSSQWWNRPDDQRFLSLEELYGFVAERSERSYAETVATEQIEVRAEMDDEYALTFRMPDGQDVSPNHWSFGQVCSLIGAPASHYRQLPAAIGGIPLQYMLTKYRGEMAKTFVTQQADRLELRAMNSLKYGRIHDYEVVKAVRDVAEDRSNGNHWKIPGVLQGWNRYDPHAPVTKESTTLYASDRDVFIFLVDDTNPIEVGTLQNGDPDLLFRGFYVWNSEVGSKSFGISTMFLRGVCMNRNLWGVEDKKDLVFRHSSNAPDRFIHEAAPVLEGFAQQSPQRLLAKVEASKAAIVAEDQDDRMGFLKKQGFSKTQSAKIIQTVLDEEGYEPKSIWDFVQGITAAARSVEHQDARVAIEEQAGKLMSKVKAI